MIVNNEDIYVKNPRSFKIPPPESPSLLFPSNSENMIKPFKQFRVSSDNFDDIFQNRIQKLVKHLRWSVLDSLHFSSLTEF